jgi:hypothetical protein
MGATGETIESRVGEDRVGEEADPFVDLAV